jgi:penicillin-binding protein 1A
MGAGPSLDDRDPRAPRRAGAAKRVARSSGRGGVTGGGRLNWKRLLRIGLIAGLVGAIAGLGSLIGLFSYYGSDPKLPNLSRLDDYRPKQVTRILDRAGTPIGELGTEKRTVVPYDAIPKLLVQAVIAAEDADYFKHGGLDYRGMLRAFIENVLRGRTAQGGSTITQQVVKTMLLSPERTMRRKVQEIILARELSQKVSKEDVLALYLNQIYYGHGRYGCEEAARYFFGKSVRDVNLAEAALLAGLPQSPERLSPRKHPDAAKTRQRYVLGQMAAHGFIERKLADRVAGEPIHLVREPASARGTAAEAVDAVSRFLSDRMGDKPAFEAGTTVATTIDARLQELARVSIERGLEDLDARQGFRGPSGRLTGKALDKRRAELAKAHKRGLKDSEIVEAIVNRVEKAPDNSKGGKLFVDVGAPEEQEGVVDLGLEPRYTKGPKPLVDRFKPGDLVRVRVALERVRPPKDKDAEAKPPIPLTLELGPQAAMVVMDPTTREILALVGGYDYHPGGFNRADRAQRQPGSAFKPIVYAAAIEAKRITPATIINDAPEVYDLWKPQNYEKEAFRGPVRVRTALAESINTVAIKVLSDVGLDATRAFATRVGITSPIPSDVGLSLALGSLTVTPLELANAFATIASGGWATSPSLVRAVGATKEQPAPLTAALPPDVAYVMVSLMRSVIEEGTARGAVSGKLRRPAAGKTGTSNGQRDAWFVGFTPDLLAAVWVGFDDMKKLGKGEAGGKTAAPIWADFMSKAVAGRPTKDFVQPPGVVVARIDKTTGLLAAPGQESGTLDEVFLDGTPPTTQAPLAGQEQSADKLLME